MDVIQEGVRVGVLCAENNQADMTKYNFLNLITWLD
jgi:hypothetical protein